MAAPTPRVRKQCNAWPRGTPQSSTAPWAIDDCQAGTRSAGFSKTWSGSKPGFELGAVSGRPIRPSGLSARNRSCTGPDPARWQHTSTDPPVGRSTYSYGIERRELILDAARTLALERGVVPSLNETAATAGVSKGGLAHHFPSRAALVQGLSTLALKEVDEAMVAAAAEGCAAETWLRISVPTGDDVALFRALAIAHRAVESPGDDVATASRQAAERWESLIRPRSATGAVPASSASWGRARRERARRHRGSPEQD